MTTKTPTRTMKLPEGRPIEIAHVAVKEFSSDSSLVAIIGQAEQQGYSVAYVYLFLGMKLAPFKQAYVNAPFRKLSQLEELMRLLQKRGEQGAQAYKLG